MPGVEIHANLIDTVISAILYYTSNKNAKKTYYNQSLKNGMNEVEALIEKNKVKINGAPFLKSGTNMKFYESLFTILLGFLITLSALGLVQL